MRYALMQVVLSRLPEVDLDEIQYLKLVKSRHDLTDFTSIEEKFDLALENHFELEREVSNYATRNMMFYDSGSTDLWDMGNVFNRRLLNTMASCRSYLDHTDHHICNVFGEDSIEQIRYKESRRRIYDSRVEFRIVEALRNFVQHRGFPLHRWSIGSEKVGDRQKFEWEYRITLRLHSEALRKDSKFNKKALKDIDDLGGHVELVWLMRGYIKALSEINQSLRDRCSLRIEEIYENIQSHLRDYRALCGVEDDPAGLAAVALNDDGIATQTTYIVPEALECRKKFVDKNRMLTNLDRSYTSTRAIMDE